MLEAGVTPDVRHRSGTDVNKPFVAVTVNVTSSTGSLAGAGWSSLTLTRQIAVTTSPRPTVLGVLGSHCPRMS
jgi:hypothetical protein